MYVCPLSFQLVNIQECQIRFNLEKYLRFLRIFLTSIGRTRMSYEIFRKVRITQIRYSGFYKSPKAMWLFFYDFRFHPREYLYPYDPRSFQRTLQDHNIPFLDLVFPCPDIPQRLNRYHFLVAFYIL